ncbi:MAG: hypothetical protein LBP88_00680 [Treponema sp.]|jgi:hypothetical protein|nr:hypothetical protein [Treponema sp.]
MNIHGMRFSFPRKGHRITLAGLFFLLSACENGLFDPSYQVEFPALPPGWQEILGTPHWRVTWIGPEGTWETAETDQELLPIRVLTEWTTPVIAYPYWPERGVAPDILRPGGGLFPFDCEKDRIRLSWRGGVEALVYRELAAHAEKGSSRLPHYFNWPRFRALLEGPDLPEEVQQDLWSVDWKGICLKTAQSGFNRRRIVPQVREELPSPVRYNGPWISTSPFQKPVYQEAGTLLHFLVSGSGDTYFSPEGMLRCTPEAWMWIPFPE